MKRWKKIALGITGVLLAAVVALGLWQRENIRTVYAFLTKGSLEIAEELESIRGKHQAELEEMAPITVSPPSTEQSEGLLSGTLTAEQVKDALGIASQLANAGRERTEEELINSCLAELYGCKVDIMVGLGAVKQEVMAQWQALPAQERTDTRKRELGLAGMRKCYELEREVDQTVREILARYRTALGEINGDLSILDTLWEYYTEEKAAEKVYYMDKYMH